jgi:glucose/arabinose dehydrogenase
VSRLTQYCPTSRSNFLLFSLGITFDPTDDKSNPDVYFTSNWFFHGGYFSSSGASVNGKIKMASGPNLDTVIDIVTGLPVSDHDHGLSAIEFGDVGELYFTCGGNTNGGVPGELSQFQQLKENFLSGAINVAYLSHPNFNGTIQWSAPDDGNMVASGIDVFASGTRNPFGLMLHSNGNLYATDNGPNIGFGRMMTGCGVNEDVYDVQRGDKVLLIQQNNYYGHPNAKRAAYFNEPRQCVWRAGENIANEATMHTPPLVMAPSAQCGMMEFHGNHFRGQLRHNILLAQYGAINSISRIILNEDGSNVIQESQQVIPMSIGYQSLDITQAPNGNIIDISYNTNKLLLIQPVEQATTQLTVNTAFPRRGRSSGGNVLSIYGVNLDFTSGDGSTNVTTTVATVGNVDCPIVTLSSTQIDCTLPGGIGTVDVTVSNGIITSTFAKGYRYVSGSLPLSFQLPVYT